MTKKLKLTFFTDGGHGWLSVKRKLLHELDIADKITRFSYQKGQSVYLEEDCDVSTFMKAFLTSKGMLPDQSNYTEIRAAHLVMKESHSRGPSAVRNYESYRDDTRVGAVLKMLEIAGVETDIASPNYVADFASKRGIALTSEQVVTISNKYGVQS